MPFSVMVDLLKILLPTCVAAIFGWVLLRRLEEVKSEAASYSDFSRKWAELFFDASSAFMVSVERLQTFCYLLTGSKNPMGKEGMEWSEQANAIVPVILENYFRIQRLI